MKCFTILTIIAKAGIQTLSESTSIIKKLYTCVQAIHTIMSHAIMHHTNYHSSFQSQVQTKLKVLVNDNLTYHIPTDRDIDK